MGSFLNLSGVRFGRLIVVRLKSKASVRPYVDTMWICQCDCGVEKIVSRGNLKNGSTASCGCLRNTQGALTRKHKLWKRWEGMISRCVDPTNKDFKNYGARGISVCERWLYFPSFLEDVGASFFAGATLDRIKVNGNYEPGNWRWATAKQQQRNKRRALILINTPWGRMSRADAAERAGIPVAVFTARVRRGWGADRLFPVQRLAA